MSPLQSNILLFIIAENEQPINFIKIFIKEIINLIDFLCNIQSTFLYVKRNLSSTIFCNKLLCDTCINNGPSCLILLDNSC